jgi:cysteine desulfurase family protein (TIGR01976 family)
MTTPAAVGRAAPGPVAGVDEIRRSFPALERMHEGVPVAYFDGPGGTQVARPVVDAMNDYLYHHNANTHWLYPTSEETDALIAASREAMADFLHASPDEIAFGQNMTSLTFHLARALGRGWSEGDEIVVTELDHHANIAPWQALARERGVTVRMVRMIPEDGRLNWDHLEHLVSRRTKLLAIGAASNAIGTINDVKGAVELAHANRALCFVDAVHYAPHALVDVQEMDCDFLSCSAYKFYGPHIGILYGRRDLLEALDVPKLDPAPDTAPERFETGTQNHEGIVGAGAAVDFLASLSGARPRRLGLMRAFDALERRGAWLIAQAWDGLAAIDGVTLYGPPPGVPRTPTLSFTMRGRSTNDVAIALARRGVFVSHGDFYAATVVERLGQAPDGLVRAGCSCYTTADEVERLLDAVRALAAG